MRQYLLLLFFLFSFTAILAENDPNQWLANQKISFTENKGQVADKGKVRKDIFYVVQGKGVKVYFTKKGLIYNYIQTEETFFKKPKDKQEEEKIRKEHPEQIIRKGKAYGMELLFENASDKLRIRSEEETGETSNYYLPHCPDGITGVKSYQKIIYENIYENIDLVFYSNEQGLKYDFIVKPGGKVDDIKLRYKDIDKIKLLNNGNIEIWNPLGKLTENKPFSYQNNKQEVKSNYKLKGRTIAFQVDNYDKSKNLIIDPSIVWATYYGGSGYDIGSDVTTDKDGNVYLTGTTESTIGIASGGFQNTIGGNQDAFLVKFASSGQRLWATYYGGTGYDNGNALAVDAIGDVYMGGITNSSAGIAVGRFVIPYTGDGFIDAFLVKFNSSGQRLWGTYYGGTYSEEVNALSIDGLDNVYLTGRTKSTTRIASGGFQNIYGGGDTDAFLVKFNSSGQRLWATYYGGTGYDNGNALAVDAIGDVYMAGYTSSIDSIASGGFQNTIGGVDDQDAFLVKFNSSGQRLWATYYGGSSIDYSLALSIDKDGNVFISGQTYSKNSIASGGFQNIYGGGDTDAFLVKFNSSGQRLWATYYGGSNRDAGSAVATDKDGNIYLAGNTLSADGISSGGFQNTLGGNTDAFLVKFSSSGQRLWATYYGGSMSDGVGNLLVAPTGDVYLAGNTLSADGISSGGFQNTLGGNTDAFLTKITDKIIPNVISGNIYQDLNENCIRETGEKPIPNIIVKAEPDGFSISDSLGNYSIPVGVGTYTIRQVLPNNTSREIITQVCPVNNYTIELTNYGNTIIKKDFSNKLEITPNIIKGTVFIDSYKNCSLDKGEKGIRGAIITLSPGNYQTISDSSGAYQFSVPEKGNFTLKISYIPKADTLVEVYCNNQNYIIQFSSFGNTNIYDFGVDFIPKKNIIKGNVFADNNKDCIKNENDLGVEKVLVVATPGNYVTETDKYGDYSLILKDTGTFNIKVITQSYPDKIITPSCEKSKTIHFSSYNNTKKINFSTEKLQYYNFIKGKIFKDDNADCIKNSNEKGISDVKLLVMPGNYTTVTDWEGNYQFALVDTGTFTITQILTQSSNTRKIVQYCPQVNQIVNFNKWQQTIEEKDFANQVTYCPYLRTSISSNLRRRCFLNNTTVFYANTGLLKAENVKVYVKMPEYVVLKKADKTFTRDNEGNYVFSIGSLDANQAGVINIQDSVVCKSGITGLTVCTKAWITPANNCKTPSSNWDKSDIVLSGKCIDNGRVRIVLKNTGDGNMADSSQMRLYLNAALALKKGFKINKGDSLVLSIPANGRTVRLEADQRVDHPRKSESNITFEGCVANLSEVVSKGFVNQFPQDDAEPEISMDCQSIRDSYDPNDKIVEPEGTTANHYTPTDAELKYLIRFQNTGTDTAYTVTVIDTLSENLDIATLQLGSSSHKYSFNLSGKGKPVLTWTFNKINLPDSTKNKLASNGFVAFSIKPKSGLAEKTKIENYADIIFDFNDPVRTNTTFNIIYDVPLTIDNTVKLDEKTVIIPKPVITSFSPAKAKIGESIVLKGKCFDKTLTNNTVKINNLKVSLDSGNDSTLVFKVPTGATIGKISVENTAGSVVSTADLTIVFPPVIGSFSPQTGVPGDKVTITGNYFEEDKTKNTVKFGIVSAEVISSTATSLEVKVPGGFVNEKISVFTTVGDAISTASFTMSPNAVEVISSDNISIFPNPTDGKVKIESKSLKISKIVVLNAWGKEVSEKTGLLSEEEEIDLSGREKGLYFLVIYTSQAKVIKKLIIQ